MSEIPDEVRERVPLMRAEWMPNYLRLLEHAAAPRWNTRCGDRLLAGDLPQIQAFADRLREFHETNASNARGGIVRQKAPGADHEYPNHINPERDHWPAPSDALLRWLRNQADESQAIGSRLDDAAQEIQRREDRAFELARDFATIRPMTRADFASRLERIIPASADLERLIVNPTSGTTGQPIPAPNHPVAVGCYDPLLEQALRLNGVDPDYARPDAVAAVQICAQQHTITYATVHAALNGAGFAKINLADHEWRRPGDARDYIAGLRPFFLSGDPYSFATLLERLESWRETADAPLFGPTGYRPRALISTALKLSEGLRARLESAFACPIVDLYSLNETGPIACSVADSPGRMRQLPPDIYIEAVDPETGASLPDGHPGEIAISGGRNPYLPLLRYRTGDVGRVYRGADGRAELELLFVREMVRFRSAAADQTNPEQSVNPVDIARILRGLPVIQFQFRQRADLSCLLTLQTAGAAGLRPFESAQLRDRLRALFGLPPVRGGAQSEWLEIEYTSDWSAPRFSSRGAGDGQRKVVPFISEIAANQ